MKIERIILLVEKQLLYSLQNFLLSKLEKVFSSFSCFPSIPLAMRRGYIEGHSHPYLFNCYKTADGLSLTKSRVSTYWR